VHKYPVDLGGFPLPASPHVILQAVLEKEAGSFQVRNERILGKKMWSSKTKRGNEAEKVGLPP